MKLLSDYGNTCLYTARAEYMQKLLNEFQEYVEWSRFNKLKSGQGKVGVSFNKFGLSCHECVCPLESGFFLFQASWVCPVESRSILFKVVCHIQVGSVLSLEGMTCPN